MDQIEQSLRIKLAAAHHIIHYHGWDDLLATHLSVRIPDTEHLLITPHNTAFEEVSASKLIKSDFNGNIIGHSNHQIMPQATNIHASIYQHSDTIMSAVHTHSINGVAVSSLACGLLFLNQQSLRFYNDTAYHDFNGLALHNEGEEMVKSLGNNKVMILKNHGLLTTGSNIEDALYNLYYLEQCCDIQIKTLSTGSKIIGLSDETCILTKKQFDGIQNTHLEFETLIRRIEGKSNVDYKS
jgi:ribulose-5-phosphate 4-epimerase/fuculose-1-phosphate aldolase